MKRIKGCWYDQDNELVIDDGVALREIKEGEVLYQY